MSELLDLTLIGLAITLEPFPIVALILLLSATRGTRKGLAFVLSWMACVVVVVALTAALTGGQPLQRSSAPSTAVLVVKLALGVLLVVLGVRHRAKIGQPHDPPSWMARLDGISYGSAIALGAFLQPWSLVAAGAATVLTASLAAFWEYATLVYFSLLATASLLAIELFAVFRRDAAGERLERLRVWLDTHRDQAIVVVSLGIGLWLMASSLYALVVAAT